MPIDVSKLKKMEEDGCYVNRKLDTIGYIISFLRGNKGSAFTYTEIIDELNKTYDGSANWKHLQNKNATRLNNYVSDRGFEKVFVSKKGDYYYFEERTNEKQDPEVTDSEDQLCELCGLRGSACKC